MEALTLYDSDSALETNSKDDKSDNNMGALAKLKSLGNWLAPPKDEPKEGSEEIEPEVETTGSLDDDDFNPLLWDEAYFWDHYFKMNLLDDETSMFDETSKNESKLSREIIQMLLEQWCFLFDDNTNKAFTKRIVYFSELIKGSTLDDSNNLILNIIMRHFSRTGRIAEISALVTEYNQLIQKHYNIDGHPIPDNIQKIEKSMSLMSLYGTKEITEPLCLFLRGLVGKEEQDKREACIPVSRVIRMRLYHLEMIMQLITFDGSVNSDLMSRNKDDMMDLLALQMQIDMLLATNVTFYRGLFISSVKDKDDQKNVKKRFLQIQRSLQKLRKLVSQGRLISDPFVHEMDKLFSSVYYLHKKEYSEHYTVHELVNRAQLISHYAMCGHFCIHMSCLNLRQPNVKFVVTEDEANSTAETTGFFKTVLDVFEDLKNEEQIKISDVDCKTMQNLTNDCGSCKVLLEGTTWGGKKIEGHDFYDFEQLVLFYNGFKTDKATDETILTYHTEKRYDLSLQPLQQAFKNLRLLHLIIDLDDTNNFTIISEKCDWYLENLKRFTDLGIECDGALQQYVHDLTDKLSENNKLKDEPGVCSALKFFSENHTSESGSFFMQSAKDYWTSMISSFDKSKGQEKRDLERLLDALEIVKTKPHTLDDGNPDHIRNKKSIPELTETVEDRDMEKIVQTISTLFDGVSTDETGFELNLQDIFAIGDVLCARNRKYQEVSEMFWKHEQYYAADAKVKNDKLKQKSDIMSEYMDYAAKHHCLDIDESQIQLNCDMLIEILRHICDNDFSDESVSKENDDAKKYATIFAIELRMSKLTLRNEKIMFSHINAYHNILRDFTNKITEGNIDVDKSHKKLDLVVELCRVLRDLFRAANLSSVRDYFLACAENTFVDSIDPEEREFKVDTKREKSRLTQLLGNVRSKQNEAHALYNSAVIIAHEHGNRRYPQICNYLDKFITFRDQVQKQMVKYDYLQSTMAFIARINEFFCYNLESDNSDLIRLPPELRATYKTKYEKNAKPECPIKNTDAILAIFTSRIREVLDECKAHGYDPEKVEGVTHGYTGPVSAGMYMCPQDGTGVHCSADGRYWPPNNQVMSGPPYGQVLSGVHCSADGRYWPPYSQVMSGVHCSADGRYWPPNDHWGYGPPYGQVMCFSAGPQNVPGMSWDAPWHGGLRLVHASAPRQVWSGRYPTG